MGAEKGDKVRIKSTQLRGRRGIVETPQTGSLIVRLDGTNELVTLSLMDVTNFSLAARKAWEHMPHRRVGRPRGSTKTDRVSVTLRVDREIWNRLQKAEKLGQLDDRVAFINQWIDRGLSELTAKHKKER